jgi:hypothetical protein
MTSVWSGHEASPWPTSLELEAPGPTFDQESPFLAAGTTAGTTASEYLAPDGNLAPAGNGPPAAHLVLAHESVEQAAVRQSIASGTRNPDVLTEVALRAHDARPDTPAPLLDPTSPPALAQREAVREQIVVPLLRSGGTVAPAGELWLPRAERVQNAKAAGGRYVDSPWRFVFHTVEAEPSAHGFRALAARHANPPHLWAMPKADLVLQTVPLNRSAYALARPGTIQTNRLHAVQVEVWGFAAKMGDVDPDFLRWLADRVLVPVARLVPINLERVEPTRGRSAYGRNSAGRLTPAEWNAFNGVCGHQHVPDNDHWDPGKLDLAAIATRARRTLGPTGGMRREDEAFADDAAFAEGASGHDGASFVAEQDGAGEGERAGNGLDHLSGGQANGYEANRYGAGGYETGYERAGPEAGMATQTQEQLLPSWFAQAAAAAGRATPMPGPRAGLTILTQLDAIHTAMAAGGHPATIASPLGGFRTIDDQIKLYAQGRTFETFKTAINDAVKTGAVTRAKADEWIKFYDPAQGANPMPRGAVVTWTFRSRHLSGDAADIVHATLGWAAAEAFWTALSAAATAQGLQIGPPAHDLAHVQRP